MLPAALDPRDHLFRKMLVLSGAAHAAAFVIFTLLSGVARPPIAVAPVAVVDLVGAPPAPPEAALPAGAGEKTASPRVPVKEKRKNRKKNYAARRPLPPPAAAPPRPAVPDTRPLAETIRKLREERRAAEQVEEAVAEMRRKKEVRQAVRGVRERVARRLDLTAAAPPRLGPAAERPPGGLPGGNGPARLPPEYLAYFRALDERVRSNWTVPDLAVKDRGSLFVQVRVAIEPDGRVSEVRMEKSSGNPYFDDSVLRAIRKASPLPVPPEQLRGTESRYEVGFRFFGSGGEAP